MVRIRSFDDISQGRLAGPPEVVALAARISSLNAVRSGRAVVMGSAAWGAPSAGSDVDLLAYQCAETADLQGEVERVREEYAAMVGDPHKVSAVDIVWIGAEHEELVERDNLVSNSAPILEPRMVSEIFARVRIRLGDHLYALAKVKGDPWRSFAAAFFESSDSDREVRRDVLREYVDAVATGWRSYHWSPAALDRGEMSTAQLEQLGHAEGFAIHYTRLVLADLGRYPQPDRRSDVRRALADLPEPWGEAMRAALTPFLALSHHYEALQVDLCSSSSASSRQDYDAALMASAAAIDFDAVEELTWRFIQTRAAE